MSGTDDDGDTITFIITDEPDFGTLNRNAETGAWVYLPGPNFPGSDSFVFVVEDSLQARSLPQRVVINGDEARVTVSAVRTVQPNFDPLSGLGVNIPPYSLNLPGMSFRVAEANLPQHGTLHVHWAEEVGSGPGTVLVSHHAPLVPGQWYDHHDLLFKPTSDFVGVDELHIDYLTEQGQVVRPQHIRLHVTSQSQDVRLLDVGDPQRGVPVEALFQSVQLQQPVEVVPDLRAWSGVTATSDTLSVSVLQQPEQGTLSVDGNRLLYQPILVAGQLDPRWQFGLIGLSVNSQPTLEQWVLVDPGYVPTPPVPSHPVLNLSVIPTQIEPTRESILAGVTSAKSVLASVLMQFHALGAKTGELSSDLDDQALQGKIDQAGTTLDDLSHQYDVYLQYLAGLSRAVGESLKNSWYLSQADADAVMDVQRLPLKVGSLSGSKQRMEELAAAVDAQTRGAGVLVDTAKGLVQYAETAHKVLSAAEMAGGATALLRTGATLLVREGYRACVRTAATQLMTSVASGLAAEFANGVADYVGLDPQYRQYIAIGVNAFQVIAFFKAAKNKVDWNGSCFLAGTQVVTGVDANGVFSTKSIEDLQVGDTVLARDQHDSADDLDPRRVTGVSRKTSNHIRTLTIAGDGGTIETLRTTDEHPFFARDRGWVAAGELRPGDRLQQPDGSWQEVLDSVREAGPDGIAVFNLEVESDHTYFVADADTSFTNPVWVHNACRPGIGQETDIINHVLGNGRYGGERGHRESDRRGTAAVRHPTAHRRVVRRQMKSKTRASS
jgi:hypothetical protein